MDVPLYEGGPRSENSVYRSMHNHVTVRGHRRSLTEPSTVLMVSKQGIFLGVERGEQLLEEKA